MPSWFDDEFFKLGCFCSLPDGKNFLFAKGGRWTQLPSTDETTFQFRDFYQSERWYYQAKETTVLSAAEISTHFLDDEQKISLTPDSDDDRHFLEDFQALQKSWNEELKKVVLTSRRSFFVQDPLKLRQKTMIKSLRAPNGYAYGFWKDDYGLIGVTPETLFDLSGQDIKTMALAGTAPKDKAQELLDSKKDREEHNLVIKNILEDLQDLAGDIQTGATVIHPYGRLVHLKTPISARLRSGVRVEDLIDKLSPTAALGGYPRSEALCFLRRTRYYEAHPHRYHGSVFCFTHQGHTRALVMIRNIQLHQNKLILEAGAGIVSLSQKEKELEEIHQKQYAIQELLL